MCSAGAAAGMQVAGGIVSAYAANQQGKTQQAYYNMQADANEKQAGYVLDNAEVNNKLLMDQAAKDAANIRQQGNEAIGSQKAAMAANGVSTDSGSGADVVNDTQQKVDLDVKSIEYNANMKQYEERRNAYLESYRLKSEASQMRLAGVNARAAGKVAAATSLLGTAGQVGSTWASSPSGSSSGSSASSSGAKKG